MLLNYFKRYMKITRGITDKSVGHYVSGINAINSLLVKYNYPLVSVFDATSIEELNGVLTFLQNNVEFQTKDTVGHHMYSVAFSHFYRFATDDPIFFETKIQALDIVIPKPQQITTSITSWKRNQILISQAIEGANYTCEHKSEHITFTSKVTNRSFMEGHHLIPLKYQAKFSNGIDVYANIVCLCPICHRLLHYGIQSEKAYAAENLYEKRCKRLIKSGIDISKNEFLKLVL